MRPVCHLEHFVCHPEHFVPQYKLRRRTI